jgi:hypothetical protein
MKDFFVSYNSRDRAWAEWISWILEAAGYSVVVEAWDFRPGGNFALDMQRAIQGSERTIAVLSDNYLQAEYTHPEWAAAFSKDPQSLKRLLIPIRVRDCSPDGLLGQIIYVDLVDCGPDQAKERVLAILKERTKPATAPRFPGETPAAVAPTFPGTSAAAPAATLNLGVYGWQSPRPDSPPLVELDWQQYCDRESRTVPSLETWDTILFPALKQAKQTLAETASPGTLALLGNRPLTMTLAIGFTFPMVGGYTFQIQQFTSGKTAPSLWYTNATPSAAKLKICREQGMEGNNLIVAIGISADIWEDVSAFQKGHRAEFDGVVYLEPDQGPGFQALASDADAVAIALHAKELIRQYRRQYQAKQVHLILACPATFALCLGQQLNALGQITAYERTEDGGYQAAMCLRTG